MIGVETKAPKETGVDKPAVVPQTLQKEVEAKGKKKGGEVYFQSSPGKLDMPRGEGEEESGVKRKVIEWIPDQVGNDTFFGNVWDSGEKFGGKEKDGKDG